MSGINAITRRGFVAGSVALALPALARAQSGIVVRDLLGREIRLAKPAARVVLGQGRFLSMIGMVHPDPIALLAGWADDLNTTFPNEAEAWSSRFPSLKSLPVIGRRVGSDYAIEKLLMLQPDLVLISRFNAGPVESDGNTSFIRRLTQAGLKVAVVDFAQDPLKDTVPSLRILSQLLGQEARGEDTVSFYRTTLKRIIGSLGDPTAASTDLVFHSHAGVMPCCASIGRGSFADLAALVRGHSIAADVLPRAVGPINLEYMLTRQPDVYVATGGLKGDASRGISIGANVSETQARESLTRVVSDPGIAELNAVRSKRAYALWHGLNETPLHLVALEALAGWLNPGIKDAFDAPKTLAAFRKRFPLLPQDGVYTVALDPSV
ncbi:ABC transporter substrate-binding protein [Breoghania sp.]|uniref:ABC transporter substrate-binding protein n=1 Tax=Breoghania sp. TaxID=2065378 RepID=UPI0029CA5856|nr:ABC transporter substrate-binding protein [Breoghania sp.]